MTSANLLTACSEEEEEAAAAGVAQGFHLREWVIGWLWLVVEVSVEMGLAGLVALDLVETWACERALF